MAMPVLMVGGVYWRCFPITIPASGGAYTTLRALLQASAAYSALLDAKQLDEVIGAKLTDFGSAVLFNICGPISGNMTIPDSANGIRPWANGTKGDWTESCTEVIRETWVRSQGAAIVCNLIVYFSKVINPVSNEAP